MPRRREVPKREILPDPKFSNVEVAKFVNVLMTRGKKSVAERITHQAMREFIARNYESDDGGRWYFQNGPQRVYVTLAYTPLVVHYEGDTLVDHCGRPFAARANYVDDEGSVVLAGEPGIALLDDRDLLRFADSGAPLERIARAEVPGRFGFVQEPGPG